MLQTLEKGLQEGAAGISLGLMYLPGISASMGELEKVALAVREIRQDSHSTPAPPSQRDR